MRSIFLAGATADAPRADRDHSRTRSLLTAAPPPALLEARRVSVSSAHPRVELTSISGGARPGEVVGLIGPNGAGKTDAVLDVALGLPVANRGQVMLGGRDVTSFSPDARADAWPRPVVPGCAHLLLPHCRRDLAYALERHLPCATTPPTALGLPDIREQEVDIAWSVSDLIELMNLGAFRGQVRQRAVDRLAPGRRHREALAHDPTVLLLDEPSSGIAQRETEALGPLLHHIRDETGCALVVIEHDMPLLPGCAIRLVAMDLGRVIAAGQPQRFLPIRPSSRPTSARPGHGAPFRSGGDDVSRLVCRRLLGLCLIAAGAGAVVLVAAGGTSYAQAPRVAAWWNALNFGDRRPHACATRRSPTGPARPGLQRRACRAARRGTGERGKRRPACPSTWPRPTSRWPSR